MMSLAGCCSTAVHCYSFVVLIEAARQLALAREANKSVTPSAGRFVRAGPTPGKVAFRGLKNQTASSGWPPFSSPHSLRLQWDLNCLGDAGDGRRKTAKWAFVQKGAWKWRG